LAEQAEFVDLHDVGGRPNVVVDGPPGAGTVLALSHWPEATVPQGFEADTSTEIVGRYLDSPSTGCQVAIVTNNHYDEDGVLAIWLLLERPQRSDPRRALAIAAAEAGDFRVWQSADAAKVALALMALVERPTTPLPAALHALSSQSGRNPAGALIAAALPWVGRLLMDPDQFEPCWRPKWEALQPDLELVSAGEARIQELPALDLAIVRAPRRLDPLALYPHLHGRRVLELPADGRVSLTYRYESWVRFISRPPLPRMDLTPLAARLQSLETAPIQWTFEGIAAITPRLAAFGPGGVAATEIGLDRLTDEVVAAFEEANSPGRR
jgi:hypothetical protein